jgi:hypothetical protein
VSKRLTRSLGVAALAAAILVGHASSSMLVFGGSVVQVQAAPWTVFVQEQAGSVRFLCTGSVVDASHVLTAAHCVFDESGNMAQPSALSVRAGVSNFSTPLPTDAEQDRSVTSFRVHPGYVATGRPSPDDVAVLALSSPLDLSGPAVQAVALPAPGAPFPAGAVGGLAGFGRQNPTIATSGPLVWMTATVDPQGKCGVPSGGLVADNGIVFCASSASSAVCSGDSGSGLVTTGGTPTLIGVVSAGSTTCEPGTHALFTFTGAPEILQFIQGNNAPPSAPRESSTTFLDLKWDRPLVVGNTLTCSTGAWVGADRFSYSFLSVPDGKALQSGPQSTYFVPASAAGERILCEVAATSAGGTTLEETDATSAVGPVPQVRIAPLAQLAGSRGGRIDLRVTLVSPLGLWGKFAVCVTLPARVGGRLCRSVKNTDGAAGTFPFNFAFRIRPTAPLGSAPVAVTAVAGASTARATTSLRVA